MGANQSAELANAVDEAEQAEAAKVRMLLVAKLRSAFQCPGYGGLGQASIFFWYFELRTAQESQELSQIAYLSISKEALRVDHFWHVSRLACAWSMACPTDVACLSQLEVLNTWHAFVLRITCVHIAALPCAIGSA